jgi:hypothetical protein
MMVQLASFLNRCHAMPRRSPAGIVPGETARHQARVLCTVHYHWPFVWAGGTYHTEMQGKLTGAKHLRSGLVGEVVV